MGAKPSVRLEDISLVVDILPTTEYAVCIRSVNSHKIIVSSLYIDKMTDIDMEQVLLHEIGHCAFWFQHNDKQHEDGRPVSIMNSYLFLPYWFFKYKDEYYVRVAKGMN